MSETREWWVTTDALARGGEKVLGPFCSQELALQVRSYIERAEGRNDLWVDEVAEPLTAEELAEAMQDLHTGNVPGFGLIRVAATIEARDAALAELRGQLDRAMETVASWREQADHAHQQRVLAEEEAGRAVEWLAALDAERRKVAELRKAVEAVRRAADSGYPNRVWSAIGTLDRVLASTGSEGDQDANRG